jgi:hypothetical protein
MDLVRRESDRLLARAGIPASLPPDILEILVTTFHELRNGRTASGKALEPLSTVMSTAEAVSVGYAAGIHAYYCDGGAPRPEHVLHGLLGSAIKDVPEDLVKLRNYFNHAVKDRKGGAWPEYYEARRHLDHD